MLSKTYLTVYLPAVSVALMLLLYLFLLQRQGIHAQHNLMAKGIVIYLYKFEQTKITGYETSKKNFIGSIDSSAFKQLRI